MKVVFKKNITMEVFLTYFKFLEEVVLHQTVMYLFREHILTRFNCLKNALQFKFQIHWQIPSLTLAEGTTFCTGNWWVTLGVQK